VKIAGAVKICGGNDVKDKKRLAFIIADNFQDEEGVSPYKFLRKNGFEIDYIAIKKGKCKGKYGRESVEAKLSFDDVSAENYAGIIIPGGAAPELLRVYEPAVNFTKHFIENEKIVAAICHGPQVLISTGLMQGRHLTSYVGIRDDIKFAGAIYSDETALQDGNIITARTPDDLETFNHAILWELNFSKKSSGQAEFVKASTPASVLKLSILKEIAAHVFYSEMAKNSRSEHVSSKFMFLSANERDHVNYCQSILKKMSGGLFYTNVKLFSNPGFANDISNLTLKDVLNHSLEAEKNSYSIYADAANRTKSAGLKKIFEMLASEEQHHMQMIETEIKSGEPHSLSSAIEKISCNMQNEW